MPLTILVGLTTILCIACEDVYIFATLDISQDMCDDYQSTKISEAIVCVCFVSLP